MSNKHWLMKSEPNTFSIDDLMAARDQTTSWEGVRNYQARNLLRDEIQEGDRVLYYHSACAEPACVGTATVVRGGYPDHFARDPRHHYYDPKSTEENPIWYMVDIRFDSQFSRPVTLAAMRTTKGLESMQVLRKGNRLSVQPVTAAEFAKVVKLGQV